MSKKIHIKSVHHSTENRVESFCGTAKTRNDRFGLTFSLDMGGPILETSLFEEAIENKGIPNICKRCLKHFTFIQRTNIKNSIILSEETKGMLLLYQQG